NLERSELEKPAPKPLHHAPWMCGDVAVFFRDRDLSDRIGFRYGKSDPADAAKDLFARLAAADEDAAVTVALDGENPWEHYPRSGERLVLVVRRRVHHRERAGVRRTLPAQRGADLPPHRDGAARAPGAADHRALQGQVAGRGHLDRAAAADPAADRRLLAQLLR